MEIYLTVQDAMRILQVSRTSAYCFIRTGRLKYFKVGRLVRFKAVDLQRFVEGRPARMKK